MDRINDVDIKIKIADNLTIGDWLQLRELLEVKQSRADLWSNAYDFFEKRMNTRYLNPIEAIERDAKIDGEGFAVTVIICSLIEALESFRLGKVYKRATKGNVIDKRKEYFKSQLIFEDFLKNREPFKSFFSEEGLATSFYENVRCAVLHEAATRNGWKIRIDTTALVVKQDNSYTLNRALFVDAIKQYMASYKNELFQSEELKLAFIRKLNSICETA
jgi:hypothetical protein